MKALIIECYREAGVVSRFAIEECEDTEQARELPREFNENLRAMGVTEHWVEVSDASA